jgi:hypothetical protein
MAKWFERMGTIVLMGGCLIVAGCTGRTGTCG